MYVCVYVCMYVCMYLQNGTFNSAVTSNKQRTTQVSTPATLSAHAHAHAHSHTMNGHDLSIYVPVTTILVFGAAQLQLPTDTCRRRPHCSSAQLNVYNDTENPTLSSSTVHDTQSRGLTTEQHTGWLAGWLAKDQSCV